MTEHKQAPSTEAGEGPEAWGHAHLLGIGGAGMSAIARLLAARGVVVSGTDSKPGPVTDALHAEGIQVFIGHDAEHLAGVDVVVASSAIRPDNPEIVAAREQGLRVLHRSEALAALMVDRRAVAVAGTHGKTTTSSMIATALREAGIDPSYAIGGQLIAADGTADGGAHAGRGDVFVAEADESDGSFLRYRPFVAVVTNVEPDHLDHYGSVEAYSAAFERFAERVDPHGVLVACVDDPGAAKLAVHAQSRDIAVWAYGEKDPRETWLEAGGRSDGAWDGFYAVRILDAGDRNGASSAVVSVDGQDVHLNLRVPGRHNVLNAAAALLACVGVGVAPEFAAEGLSEFRGTRRRFEFVGSVAGTGEEPVTVVDDYAHHPTEVAAALAAGRSSAPSRLVAVFQPHLFSRTRIFAREFAEALQGADVVIVADIYGAREDPEPGVTSALIVEVVGNQAIQTGSLDDALRDVLAVVRPGDLILTIGAGDITTLGPRIVAELTERVGATGQVQA